MEKAANEKRLEILGQKKGECISIKENLTRDIEVSRMWMSDGSIDRD